MAEALLLISKLRPQYIQFISKCASAAGPGRTYRQKLLAAVFWLYMDHEISPEALQSKLKNTSAEDSSATFCLLDVREPWEAALCSIPGSRLIPMGEIPSRAHQELDPDAHIVAYCHYGARSLNVVLWLREQGFANTQSLAGGIDAWSQKIEPAIPRY